MAFNINDVVAKYVGLRDEKASIAERHKQELAPLMESMETIEKYLLQEMEKMGVDSLKTPAGTPYKAVTKSVKMQDPESFKRYTLQPVVDALSNIPNMPDVYSILLAGIRWDMIDFRAGKKGITDHIEQTGEVPPGVEVNQFTALNIRRA